MALKGLEGTGGVRGMLKKWRGPEEARMRNRGGDMMEGGLKFMDFARNTVKGCCVDYALLIVVPNNLYTLIIFFTSYSCSRMKFFPVPACFLIQIFVV